MALSGTWPGANSFHRDESGAAHLAATLTVQCQSCGDGDYDKIILYNAAAQRQEHDCNIACSFAVCDE